MDSGCACVTFCSVPQECVRCCRCVTWRAATLPARLPACLPASSCSLLPAPAPAPAPAPQGADDAWPRGRNADLALQKPLLHRGHRPLTSDGLSGHFAQSRVTLAVDWAKIEVIVLPFFGHSPPFRCERPAAELGGRGERVRSRFAFHLPIPTHEAAAVLLDNWLVTGNGDARTHAAAGD